jgi:hypothetical protein
MDKPGPARLAGFIGKIRKIGISIRVIGFLTAPKKPKWVGIEMRTGGGLAQIARDAPFIIRKLGYTAPRIANCER